LLVTHTDKTRISPVTANAKRKKEVRYGIGRDACGSALVVPIDDAVGT
jgi:hypothetical protein